MILKYFDILGDFREEALAPDVIFFKTKSTFLVFKVKKAWLDIEFSLDREEDIHPVKKYLRTPKRRVVHLVSIDNEEDINVQLLDWIGESYRLIGGVEKLSKNESQTNDWR